MDPDTALVNPIMDVPPQMRAALDYEDIPARIG
jgi:hypothetical protein